MDSKNWRDALTACEQALRFSPAHGETLENAAQVTPRILSPLALRSLQSGRFTAEEALEKRQLSTFEPMIIIGLIVLVLLGLWYLERKRSARARNTHYRKRTPTFVIFCCGLYFFDGLLVGLPSLGTLVALLWALGYTLKYVVQRNEARKVAVSYAVKSAVCFITASAIICHFLSQQAPSPNEFLSSYSGSRGISRQTWKVPAQTSRSGTSEQNLEHLKRTKLNDEEFKQLMVKYSTAPLVAMMKYPEPFDDLNPSLKVKIKPFGGLKGTDPKRILAMVSAQFASIFKD